MALAAPVHRDRPRNAAPLRIVRLGVWFGRAGKAPYLHLLAGLSHGLLIHSIGRLVINWESHSFIHSFISYSEAPLGSIQSEPYVLRLQRFRTQQLSSVE